MDQSPTTIIREALTHSLYLGYHSDLDYFTTLQKRALSALEALETGDNGHKCTCRGNGKENAPNGLKTSPAACSWPREEACEE